MEHIGEDDRADEFDDMSVEEYAEQRRPVHEASDALDSLVRDPAPIFRYVVPEFVHLFVSNANASRL